MASPPHAPVAFDPPSDTAHPASLAAFVIPSLEGALNAVMYTAAGVGAHPTLLLLHGFPGNEQNLDLAQVARRAGWNVLTFHYRGSWGSPGAFSVVIAPKMLPLRRLIFGDPKSSLSRGSIWHALPWLGTAWAG